MINRKLESVESYGDTFRDLINMKNWSNKGPIRKILRLDKDEDWAFLCSAMDIIGDTCLAIDNFLKFGLSGPTKCSGDGEKYLRLYGILSATYIQQEAVLKLYTLVNAPMLKKWKDKINTLEIRLLRHKLSSHSTNYRDLSDGSIQTCVPIRVYLQDFSCGYRNNKEKKNYSVDLQKAIEDHLDMLIDMQDNILDKAIKTLYKNQETNRGYIKFVEKLKNLRSRRSENITILSKDGSQFIITMGWLMNGKRTT